MRSPTLMVTLAAALHFGACGGNSGGGGGDGSTGPDGSAGSDAAVCNHGGPSGQLLWSTLDDANAIVSPIVGNGGGASFSTSPGADFVAARECTGIRIDADGEFLQFVQQGNIDLTRGTIDFWYLPDANHSDGLNHVMFATTNNSVRGGFICRKAASDNANMFQVIIIDDAGSFAGENGVASADYAFTAGTWVNIRVTWDFTVGPNEANVHIYFDGTEPPFTPTMGPVSMPAAAPDEHIRIGVRDNADEWPAGGVIDELMIWDSPRAP